MLALVSSLLSGAVSTSAAPEPTLSFPLEADASIKAGSPGGNFGTASKLEVDGSPLKHTLLRFTVSGVGSAQVLSAKLRLYDVDSSNAGGTFYPVADDAWLESSVTWNNAPAAGPGPLASLGSVSSGTWYEVDLSTYVTGDGTYSLRMQSTSSNGADYTSAEGTAANRPTVVVTLSSDTVAPTVSIGSPAADATLAGLITVLSDASDDTGVAVVDLLLDGVPLGSDLSAPYEFPWDTRSTQNGTHELQARATDASGNTSDSAIVGVTVDNAPDLGPPEPPTGLVATAISAGRVELSWTASTDDIGVIGYTVLREGVEVGTTSDTSYLDLTARPSTSYSYTVTTSGNGADYTSKEGTAGFRPEVVVTLRPT